MFSDFVKDAAITLASIFRNRVLVNGNRVDFNHKYVFAVKKLMVMIKCYCYLSLNDRELYYLARFHWHYAPTNDDLNNITYLTATLLIPYHRIWDKQVNNRPWLFYMAQQAKVTQNTKVNTAVSVKRRKKLENN